MKAEFLIGGKLALRREQILVMNKIREANNDEMSQKYQSRSDFILENYIPSYKIFNPSQLKFIFKFELNLV